MVSIFNHSLLEQGCKHVASQRYDTRTTFTGARKKPNCKSFVKRLGKTTIKTLDRNRDQSLGWKYIKNQCEGLETLSKITVLYP